MPLSIWLFSRIKEIICKSADWINQPLLLIHKKHLAQDFPPDEVKPLAIMLRMMARNLYPCYGLYDDETLVAYAFLSCSQTGDSLLLDYFAVISSKRNQGYGSYFIREIAGLYRESSGLVAEVECPEMATDPDEIAIRMRRKNFYLRNGFCATAVKGRIFGVDYDILYRPLAAVCQDVFISQELDTIYRHMLPEQIYQANIHLTV